MLSGEIRTHCRGIISLGAQRCGELKALHRGPEEAAGMPRCQDTQPLEAWASDHNSR